MSKKTNKVYFLLSINPTCCFGLLYRWILADAFDDGCAIQQPDESKKQLKYASPTSIPQIFFSSGAATFTVVVVVVVPICVVE